MLIKKMSHFSKMSLKMAKYFKMSYIFSIKSFMIEFVNKKLDKNEGFFIANDSMK